MTGPAEGKYTLKKVKVYIHEKGKARARITHIDIESPEIAKIIKPGEATYCAGKEGGCFIGLKKDMLERAKKLIEKKKRK
ncbi:MAG: hypothetical protein IB618_01395 [Candidatus Pacearchaeota archaeon]|nr:MAG: hypothetical protein IB618_01395 [Candidatus Pacearchaeota archaeon]